MENATLIETANLLQQSWGLNLAGDPSQRSWEDLALALEAHLAHLLAHDFAHLVNVMYRLDVPEQRFNLAMAAPTLGERAHLLADAVLARERLRAEMRIRYSSPPSADTSGESI